MEHCASVAVALWATWGRCCKRDRLYSPECLGSRHSLAIAPLMTASSTILSPYGSLWVGVLIPRSAAASGRLRLFSLCWRMCAGRPRPGPCCALGFTPGWTPPATPARSTGAVARAS